MLPQIKVVLLSLFVLTSLCGSWDDKIFYFKNFNFLQGSEQSSLLTEVPLTPKLESNRHFGTTADWMDTTLFYKIFELEKTLSLRHICPNYELRLRTVKDSIGLGYLVFALQDLIGKGSLYPCIFKAYKFESYSAQFILLLVVDAGGGTTYSGYPLVFNVSNPNYPVPVLTDFETTALYTMLSKPDYVVFDKEGNAKIWLCKQDSLIPFAIETNKLNRQNDEFYVLTGGSKQKCRGINLSKSTANIWDTNSVTVNPDCSFEYIRPSALQMYVDIE